MGHHRIRIRDFSANACFRFLFAFSLVTFVSWGCGGGSTTSTAPPPPPPPPAPDFNLQTSAQSINVIAGSSTNVQVSITPLNSFSGTVSVSISGLPEGVTSLPASPFNVTPAAPQTVTLTASNSAALGTFPISFQGTSGALQHSAPASLQVQTNQLASFTV